MPLIVVLNRAASTGGMTRRQVEDAIGLRVDAIIPNLPRQISNAATLGEPAVTRHVGFRSAIAELARQAAPMRLLEGSPPPARPTLLRFAFWRRQREPTT
ncbi:MAG TPA: hypothetical protein VLI93_09585 [Acetobacteraceae bacterium]|nr:hypothetical protein [Acetobacteraceae bacterium]